MKTLIIKNETTIVNNESAIKKLSPEDMLKIKGGTSSTAIIEDVTMS